MSHQNTKIHFFLKYKLILNKLKNLKKKPLKNFLHVQYKIVHIVLIAALFPQTVLKNYHIV